MTKEELKNVPREEKIEMLRGLVNGTVRRIGNKFVDMSSEGSVLVISKEGKEFLNGDPLCELPGDFRENFKGSMIMMPDNGRGDL